MKNITTILLLIATSIIAVTTPASAGQEADYQTQHEYNQRANDGYNQPAPTYKSTPSSPTRNPSSSSSGSSSSPSSGESYSPEAFGAGLGVLTRIISGFGIISNQGVIMYGFRANFPIGEKIKLRAGAYSNLAGSSDPESNTINASLTYNFSDPGTTFNPFLGVGYGANTIGKGGANNSPGTSASSFYYTGGVDLNFSWIHITTAVNLPNNSAYGTEFQAAVNIGGGF